jgi:hypothetical protein
MSQGNKALAGMIGPVVFGAVMIALTIIQYDFMTGLGWRPLGNSGVPWPSGLALGPFGWFQVANFVFFGACVILFALGLHNGVAGGSKTGPALLVAVGVAMVFAAFTSDPDISDGPQTWHGVIHGISYLVFVFTSTPAFFFVWRRMRKDPLWRGYGLVTLITGVLCAILFFMPGAAAFYVFLALILAWIEAMAIRLHSLASKPTKMYGG